MHENTPDRSALPDHAAEPDDRDLPIDQVGIRGLRYPITVWDRSQQRQNTVAEIALSVGLPAHFKGTHMSRFIEVLESHRGEISLGTVPEILSEVQRRLEADDAFLSVAFPYFLERRAPVSGARSLMEYPCRFEAARRGEVLDFALHVRVPVTTLCPCSKAVSEYGAHNQRGLVDVTLRFDGMVWIEDVVDAIESCASSPLYALLKREDEKYVTEAAYDNPRFVEDLVRDCVMALRKLDGVQWLEVQAENLESIHNHSAWARLQWPAEALPAAATASSPSSESFGRWLRARREQRGQAQKDLAQQIGVSGSLLSRVERDDKSLNAEALDALSQAWGLDARKLRLRAGILDPDLLAAIQANPEGFLGWAG